MGRHFSTIPDEVPVERVLEGRLSDLLGVMERYRPAPRSPLADAEALVRSAWRLLYEERLARERQAA
jgi:hypothetical protein